MEILKLEIENATDPEIGRWLNGLQLIRQKTIRTVESCSLECLEWEGPNGEDNSISGLLAHLSRVEMAWLYMDMLGVEIPAEVAALHPYPSREDSGRIFPVKGIDVESHLQRLEQTRQIFLEEMRKVSVEEWRRLRLPVDGPKYEVTPEWIVFHLIEHEAGHNAQMSSMKARWEREK